MLKRFFILFLTILHFLTITTACNIDRDDADASALSAAQDRNLVSESTNAPDGPSQQSSPPSQPPEKPSPSNSPLQSPVLLRLPSDFITQRLNTSERFVDTNRSNLSDPSDGLDEPDISWSVASFGAASGGDGFIVGAEALASLAKEAFSDTEIYEYTEPLFNVPDDNEFTIGGEYFKRKHNDKDFADFIEKNITVYCSPDFDERVKIRCDYRIDAKSGELFISPSETVFDISAHYGVDAVQPGPAASGVDARSDRIAGDERAARKSWGNAPKYYLVCGIDADTGETLDKPAVTLFTIKKELDAPQLKYRVDDYGRLIFYWNPVEGADYYLIGDINAKDGEYSAKSFTRLDIVTDYEWRKIGDSISFGQEAGGAGGTGGDYKSVFDSLYQGAAYVVVAVNENGNSSLSNTVAFNDFAPSVPLYADYSLYGTPLKNDDGTVLKTAGDHIYVKNPVSAPVYQAIAMLDGSYKLFVIDYPDSLAAVDKYEGRSRVMARTRGTMFMNGIIIEDMGGRQVTDVLRYLNMREETAVKSAGGVVWIDIAIYDKPSVDIDFDSKGTIAGISGISGADGAEGREASAKDAASQKSYELIDVYANTPLSAFLAINFVNHAEEISLRAFPEAADGALLVDAILEAYYQNNHYIGGMELNRLKYDFSTRILTAEYAMSAAEQRALRAAVDSRADGIIGEIIADGMTDYEKEEAINNYLCDRTEYDYNTLNELLSIQKENKTISETYKYYQTAYGALVEGKGICQAYAEAFNVLAGKAGLRCVVVTGKLNGVGGHAWNRVLIDGQWFTLDVTNNQSDEFYNEFFNMPDEIAAAFVTENANYACDSALSRFTAEKYGYDYYSRNGMSTTLDGLERYIAENIENEKRFGVFLADIKAISEDGLAAALENAARATGKAFTPRMYLWVLRIIGE